MAGGTAGTVGREANRPPETCLVRSVGTENQDGFSAKDKEQEEAPYKIVFEPDTPMVINFLHSECRRLQRIIDRPKRCPRRIANSGCTMTRDAPCFSVIRSASATRRKCLMGNPPHDVYQPSTAGGSNIRFKDSQITPDSGLAHEGAQMEVSAITKYPRVPMLRYTFTELRVVLWGIKRGTHCEMYFPGSLSSIPASNDPAAVNV